MIGTDRSVLLQEVDQVRTAAAEALEALARFKNCHHQRFLRSGSPLADEELVDNSVAHLGAVLGGLRNVAFDIEQHEGSEAP